MVKHTQAIRRLFDHFMGLALKGLNWKTVTVHVKLVKYLNV